MRLLKLELENVRSYREATVEFPTESCCSRAT